MLVEAQVARPSQISAVAGGRSISNTVIAHIWPVLTALLKKCPMA